MDHGARQQTDKSARQRAEDILRRKGEKRRELSPLPSDKVEKKLDSVPDNGVDHRTMLPGNQPDFSKTRPITSLSSSETPSCTSPRKRDDQDKDRNTYDNVKDKDTKSDETDDDKDRKNDDTGDKVGTSDDTGADDKASTTNEKGDDAVASLTSLAADTSTSTTPEFDINANSPDYHHHHHQQPVFVEHNPVAISQSEASSSSSNGQSDDMRRPLSGLLSL
nr:hypothetical protein BaRGS_004014 [Batillaria attramentaria]